MRPDVKLGVVISAVVVLVTGGYFMLRNKGDQPVPLSGQPAATAPAAGKDQKDAAGKTTAKNPATKPSGTQTDARGARTRPGVDGSNAAGRTAGANPNRVTDAPNQPGRAANPGGATRNPQVASQNPGGTPSGTFPSGTRTTAPASVPSVTPEQTPGERVASRDMATGSVPGVSTAQPNAAPGQNPSASNPVHPATPGSATSNEVNQPVRSENPSVGLSPTPRLASSPVDGGASPVPTTGRTASTDANVPSSGAAVPRSGAPITPGQSTTGGAAPTSTGLAARDAQGTLPGGAADSRLASGRDAASPVRQPTSRESMTPNRGAPATTPSSESARDARSLTPNTTPSSTRTDGAGGAVETHRVQSGDTFASLARKYYGSERYTDFLVKSNAQIATPDRLAIGMTVRIPPAPTEEQLAQSTSGASRPAATEKKADGVPTSKPGDARSSESKAADTRTAGANVPGGNVADGKPVAAASGRTYRVKEGDTFYSIAKSALGSSARWKELFELNKQAVQGDPTRLRAGQTLTLPKS